MTERAAVQKVAQRLLFAWKNRLRFPHDFSRRWKMERKPKSCAGKCFFFGGFVVQ